MRTTTTKAQLVDHRVRDVTGESLDQLLTRLREQGVSLRNIAERLHRLTGVTMSHQTVRNWLDPTR